MRPSPRHHAFAVLAALTLALVGSAPRASADESIKDPAVLAERLRVLAHNVADSNVSLAKRLEQKKCLRESRDELLLALELEPDHKNGRAALGWKREGDAWVGGPVPLAGSPGTVSEGLAKERTKAHEDGAKRLGALARAALNGGQEAEARRIAGLALEESPEEPAAREVLGHVRSSAGLGATWLSPREVRLRDAFARAFEKAPKGETKKGPEDDALSKLLGLGPLTRRETPHVPIFVSAAAEEKDLAGLARVAGTTWAAHRYFLAGDASQGFSVEGETTAPIGTGLLAGKAPVALLFLHPDEHELFLERGVADKAERASAKGGAGWSTTIQLAKGSLHVCETASEPARRAEAAAHDVAWCLSFHRLDAADREFVSEGLARFFSARATGRADIQYVSAQVTGGTADDWEGGSLAELRARVRGAVRGLGVGALRGLLERNLSDMTGEDVVRSFAFADFMLDRHRPAFARFASQLRTDELAATTLERAAGAKVEALESELREWVRLEE